MVLRFVKYAYEIAFVNALFLLVVGIVLIPIVFGLIMLSGPASNYFDEGYDPCYPQPFDGCQ